MQPSQPISIERQVLLFEIDRRCGFDDCNQRVKLGLTKSEALDYCGFECTFCERWNADSLKQTDVPDWWDEIQANQQVS